MIVVDFKVGDRVRPIAEKGMYWAANWPIATVIGVDGMYPKIRADDGREGDACTGYWELVPSDDTELQALRAFKETALASGYVLPEPPKPETDEEAAIRLRDEWWDTSDAAVIWFAKAIAWARANPR